MVSSVFLENYAHFVQYLIQALKLQEVKEKELAKEKDKTKEREKEDRS